MKSVKDILKLNLSRSEEGIKESGVKNPVYYAIEYPDNRKMFGKSNRKLNEFETLDRIRAVKKVSFPGCLRVAVYNDEEEFNLERKIK